LANRYLFSVKLRHYGKKSGRLLPFFSQVLNMVHLYSLFHAADQARIEEIDLGVYSPLKDFHGIFKVYPDFKVPGLLLVVYRKIEADQSRFLLTCSDSLLRLR
jgi:hypothetical protein